MNQNDIIAGIRRNQAAIEAEGVTSVYLFGSHARGDADEHSDVDLFVDYDRGIKGYFSLFELVAVKHIVEDEIGLHVDVVPRNDLKRIRSTAERDAIQVF